MMKCPYCAEDIRDEAIVCYHCGRDFALVKPLVDKVTSLEHQVTKLAVDLRSVPVAAAGGALAPILCGVVAILFTSGYFLAAFGVRISPGDLPIRGWAINLAILAPPVALGFLVGASWRRGRLRVVALLGLLVGLANLATAWWLVPLLPSRPEFNWRWGWILFGLCQPAVFWSAALVGRTLKRLYSEPPPGGEPFRLSWLEGRIDRLAAGIRSVQVIITLLMQVISWGVGYLTAQRVF